jgi:hypothetical protein
VSVAEASSTDLAAPVSRQKTRILALDHYFSQDLAALSAHPRLDVRWISYHRLRRAALNMMGPEVGTGLEAFAQPANADARARYSAWLRDEVRRLYLERSFDVFVLPSDTFFYVRDLPQALHAIGIPVVVVQKETTISPDTMEDHSVVVGKFAPFVCDLMTVCSERHREFWLRTGADPGRVVVTGQPRFDLYASALERPVATVTTVLFLSYFLDAYQPGVGSGLGLQTWEPLRTATERALVSAAALGRFRLVVKRHPQQPEDGEERLLRGLAGNQWGESVTLADSDADTRELIRDADAVVGFQTTALYEAVAAGRLVVYAAWGSAYEQAKSTMIPFEEAPAGCVKHATSAESLVELLARGRTASAAGCKAWVEDALGIVDGKATERTAADVRRIAAEWPPGDIRAQLDRARARYSAMSVLRSTARELTWMAARLPAIAAGRDNTVKARQQVARGQRRMAIEALRSKR